MTEHGYTHIVDLAKEAEPPADGIYRVRVEEYSEITLVRIERNVRTARAPDERFARIADRERAGCGRCAGKCEQSKQSCGAREFFDVRMLHVLMPPLVADEIANTRGECRIRNRPALRHALIVHAAEQPCVFRFVDDVFALHELKRALPHADRH